MDYILLLFYYCYMTFNMSIDRVSLNVDGKFRLITVFCRLSQIVEFFGGRVAEKLKLSDRMGIPTRLWSSESILQRINLRSASSPASLTAGRSQKWLSPPHYRENRPYYFPKKPARETEKPLSMWVSRHSTIDEFLTNASGTSEIQHDDKQKRWIVNALSVEWAYSGFN